MPTMLLKLFQIKQKLIHIRLQITISIISLLSYCGNWSVSEKLSNRKEMRGVLCRVWKWVLHHTFAGWLIDSPALWQSLPCTRPWSTRQVTSPLLLPGTGKDPAAGTALQGGDSGTMLVLLEGLLCLLPDLPVLYTFLATTLSTGGQVKQNKMLVFNLPNSKAKLEAFNFLRKTVSVNWTIPGLCLLL